MKADYDSEADALSIDLISVDSWDGSEYIDDNYCQVSMRNGRPANIELLNPADHLELLRVASERLGLDAETLLAAANAALAAPDRAVTLDVAPPAASAAA
jgi:hypothetical protein